MLSEAKSSIYFSENTSVDMKAEICGVLNIMTEALSDKYLGLPASIGAEKSDCFQSLDRPSESKDIWVEGKTP
jgi:hypothetical protein